MIYFYKMLFIFIFVYSTPNFPGVSNTKAKRKQSMQLNCLIFQELNEIQRLGSNVFIYGINWKTKSNSTEKYLMGFYF